MKGWMTTTKMCKSKKTRKPCKKKKRGGFVGAVLGTVASTVGGLLIDKIIEEIEAAKRPPIDLDKSDLVYSIPPFFKTKSNPTGAYWLKPGETEEEAAYRRGFDGHYVKRGKAVRRRRRKH